MTEGRSSGVRIAFAWMTVLPVGTGEAPDARTAGRAMTALPLVGLVVGLLAAAVTRLLCGLGADPLLAGALTTVTLVALTRGMHVDALADVADGLGSYAGPERAREIMRSSTIGPMGVAAVCLALVTETAAIAQLAGDGAWEAIAAAVTLSRCLPLVQLRRGVPAASDTGFGALVAGSQGRLALAWGCVVAAACGVVLGLRGLVDVWSGAATGALLALGAMAAAAAFARHAVRRLGGIGGDVLGATIEVGAAAALALAALLAS